MTGPLRAVLTAVEGGASTLAAVRASTGLDQSVLDAAVAHLVRSGRLGSSRLTLSCSSGCGGCPVSRATGGCAPGAPRALWIIQR